VRLNSVRGHSLKLYSISTSRQVRATQDASCHGPQLYSILDDSYPTNPSPGC
jgi:hypothetical protein